MPSFSSVHNFESNKKLLLEVPHWSSRCTIAGSPPPFFRFIFERAHIFTPPVRFWNHPHLPHFQPPRFCVDKPQSFTHRNKRSRRQKYLSIALQTLKSRDQIKSTRSKYNCCPFMHTNACVISFIHLHLLPTSLFSASSHFQSTKNEST
jgi:hypothetical protein